MVSILNEIKILIDKDQIPLYRILEKLYFWSKETNTNLPDILRAEYHGYDDNIDLIPYYRQFDLLNSVIINQYNQKLLIQKQDVTKNINKFVYKMKESLEQIHKLKESHSVFVQDVSNFIALLIQKGFLSPPALFIAVENDIWYLEINKAHLNNIEKKVKDQIINFIFKFDEENIGNKMDKLLKSLEDIEVSFKTINRKKKLDKNIVGIIRDTYDDLNVIISQIELKTDFLKDDFLHHFNTISHSINVFKENEFDPELSEYEFEKVKETVLESNRIVRSIKKELSYSEYHAIKENDQKEILFDLETIIRNFPRGIRSYNNHLRSNKSPIKFQNEYDFQDYLRLVISVFSTIIHEQPIPKNIDDGMWGKIEFEIASESVLIETKFIEDRSELNKILTSINDKLIRYKDSPTMQIIYFVIWDENSSITDPESIEKEYTKDYKIGDKSFFSFLIILKP